MAEAFPQPQDEVRTGNVIRRRGGERTHEKREHDYVFDYIEKYGDPHRREREFSGRSFEHILGAPDVEKINGEAQREGLIYCKQGKSGDPLCFIKNEGRYHEIDKHSLGRYFELVKEFQGKNDPFQPQLHFPRDLIDALRKHFSGKEGEKSIAYYTSVGTALDHTHDIGADAFLEIDGNIITFDITLREDKEEGENLGADVLVEERDISMIHEINPTVEGVQYELAEKAYTQQIDTLAKRIARVYEERLAKAA